MMYLYTKNKNHINKFLWQKQNLIRKENNISIEERFNENNNVRNEDISVKIDNNNINYKIIFLITKPILLMKKSWNSKW